MGNVLDTADSRSKMAGKHSNTKTQYISRAKKTGGGTAVGGGVNFQAVATAIVGVHILRGTALNWLEGVCSDKPVAVWAESEGPGDDLRIELENNSKIEIQAKKGLARGRKLWTALHSIAEAIHKGHLSYGVLVVASDSSKTICKDLATDIERLGQGRTDSLTDIGTDWAKQLSKANIPPHEVCRCMRIRVIHALSAEDTNISAAKEVLRYVCARENDVDAAWNSLYRQAVLLIEKRGRWTLQDLVRLLRSTNIAIREDDFPASVLDRQTKWVVDTNGHFSITGVRRKIPLLYLLPMHLERMEFKRSESNDALSALERYHKSTERKPYSEVFDSIWTARFKTLAVVIAGPGLGKSTMIKELAHQYAQDGYLVLSVALKPIAAAMRQGGAFSELLLNHSLDGSGISPSQIKNATRFKWVVLADGLDECGSAHHEVAEQINRFALGHPSARIVVTTRPIGYDTAVLSNWTHYRLLPPLKDEGADNLAKLVGAASIDESSQSSAPDISQYQLGPNPPSDTISISPQLLGMAASLILHRYTLPRTRLELYSQLINLFEKLPADTAPEQTDVADTVLNIIGWNLISNPLITFDQLIERTAATLAPMMGTTPLASKKDVRLAVAHWESVGLLEKIFHDGTKLLTFIHKTFCEFVASRFLVCQPKDLIEHVVDQPDKQEVINFAVGQGLADELIALYLSRHASGRPQQLQPALALLGHQEILVSDRWTQELIRQSFKTIEDGASDKFSIGIALSDVGAKASHLVEAEAASKLEAFDSAVKLVAWATAVSYDSSHYDATTIAVALLELLPKVEPFNIRDIFDKKDRSDRELVQRVALAALKAQPDDRIRSFAEHELKDEKLRTVNFIFQINHILRSRGIEELPTPLPEAKRAVSPVTLSPVGVSWRQANLYACRSIATAFINDKTPAGLEQKRRRAFPQFAGLMSASGFMTVPVSDLYSWAQAHDEHAVHSTMKAVAALIPLDVHALAQEAREVLHILDTNACESMFDFLPAVDIAPPAWEKVTALPINREEVKRALLHTSTWINHLAANICEYLPMTRDELEVLLSKAKGYSLRCVINLILHHHFEETTQMMLQHLDSDATGDVSGIFEVLRKLDTPPSTGLMNSTLACLCSDNEKASESATELLCHWLDQGIPIDETPVAKAVDQWGGRDGYIHHSFTSTPLLPLIELLNRIEAAQ